MRAIMMSATYQRSSEALAENAADTRFYSHYYPHRLMAEVLHDAIGQLTSVPTKFFIDRRNAKQDLSESYPIGLRALQLPDTQTDSYFLKVFGRPDREKTCECERTLEPSISQVLHLANGEILNKKLEAKNGILAQWLGQKRPDPEILDDIYLGSLCRRPSNSEKEKILNVVEEAPAAERRQAWEDVYWAVLSSKEFLFNH